MSDLKDKAIKIQGKDYVLVADRVLKFNEDYPKGCIQTKLVSPYDSELIVIKAKIVPSIEFPDRYFTGYSQEKVGDGFINKSSAMENAETSAVGRALAMMGIGVIDSIASVDEINKANNTQKSSPSGSKTNASLDDLPEEVKDIDNGDIVPVGGVDYIAQKGISKKGEPYFALQHPTEKAKSGKWAGKPKMEFGDTAIQLVMQARAEAEDSIDPDTVPDF